MIAGRSACVLAALLLQVAIASSLPELQSLRFCPGCGTGMEESALLQTRVTGDIVEAEDRPPRRRFKLKRLFKALRKIRYKRSEEPEPDEPEPEEPEEPEEMEWFLGKAAETCTDVCMQNGFDLCNRSRMAEVDSEAAITEALATVDYNCTTFLARGYAGIPAVANRSFEDCHYFNGTFGAWDIVCKANQEPNHLPLCACMNNEDVPMRVGNWFIADADQNCNNKCQAENFSECNKTAMGEINSPEAIVWAFEQVGYSCGGIRGARSYPGIPSAADRDSQDCHYWNSGSPSSNINCDSVQSQGHRPLCACI